MSQLTITLDTEDAKVIKAVSGMLIGLMDGDEIVTTNEAKFEEHVAANTAVDEELDSEGMAWDARIHSGAKSKTADGKWKLLRGVDKELVEAVRNEGNDKPTPSDTTESIATPKDEATEAAVPPPPPTPEPEVVPAPPAPTSGITELTQLLPAIREAKLDPKAVVEACKAVGVNAVVELNLPANKHLIPDVAMMLGLD